MSELMSWPVRALVVVAVVGVWAGVRPAAGQAYTPYEQHRSLDLRADVQIPPDVAPTVTRTGGEQSDDVGGFDRSLTVTAAGPDGGDPSAAPYASFTPTARQRLAYGPATITGEVATGFESREVGAQAGGSADALVDLRFLVNQGGAGRLAARGVNAGTGGFFATLADLDTEDPHGGPTVIWGAGLSGGLDDRSFDVPIDFLAGHRYRLQARTENDLEILRNEPENRTLSDAAQFSFSITVPEPGVMLMAGAAGMVLLGRRRSSR